MSASVWTPERLARLVTLWCDGVSALAIARELGNGIMRNSVIGRINRFRETEEGAAAVARRGSPVRTPLVEPGIVDVPQFLGVPLPEIAAPEPDVGFQPEVIDPPAPLVELQPQPAAGPTQAGVALVDLHSLACRFPLWGGSERTGLFCGEPKEPGRTSYCSHHRAICEPGRLAAPKIGRAA